MNHILNANFQMWLYERTAKESEQQKRKDRPKRSAFRSEKQGNPQIQDFALTNDKSLLGADRKAQKHKRSLTTEATK
jgi:hypothetical protein